MQNNDIFLLHCTHIKMDILHMGPYFYLFLQSCLDQTLKKKNSLSWKLTMYRPGSYALTSNKSSYKNTTWRLWLHNIPLTYTGLTSHRQPNIILRTEDIICYDILLTWKTKFWPADKFGIALWGNLQEFSHLTNGGFPFVRTSWPDQQVQKHVVFLSNCDNRSWLHLPFC